MSNLRKQTMEELEAWHERQDAIYKRRIEKTRQKNLEEIRSCRKKLHGTPYARFRAKKMAYLDKMESYVKMWAWLPWSFRRMLSVWFYNEDKKGLEMYDEFLPLG